MNYAPYGSYIEMIARTAQELRIPMSHTPNDDEYMSVLSYRVDQEIIAARRRLAKLENFRHSFSQ